MVPFLPLCKVPQAQLCNEVMCQNLRKLVLAVMRKENLTSDNCSACWSKSTGRQTESWHQSDLHCPSSRREASRRHRANANAHNRLPENVGLHTTCIIQDDTWLHKRCVAFMHKDTKPSQNCCYAELRKKNLCTLATVANLTALCFQGELSPYFCGVLITRCTVSPSLIPCWFNVSLSFRIFPAKIRTSWSCLALNRLEISSLNWNGKTHQITFFPPRQKAAV